LKLKRIFTQPNNCIFIFNSIKVIFVTITHNLSSPLKNIFKFKNEIFVLWFSYDLSKENPSFPACPFAGLLRVPRWPPWTQQPRFWKQHGSQNVRKCWSMIKIKTRLQTSLYCQRLSTAPSVINPNLNQDLINLLQLILRNWSSLGDLFNSNLPN